ncbi:MAG: autotransporter outer membrane beta-barrel domain-containing protein [Winogradskyella sp.]|jgi:hypothetical protein
MKITSLLFLLTFSVCVFAQVGVGTTTPDASSILDITASDKGVLVPRVNLIDVADVTAPINTPATGLLVWNTNGAVTGGSGVGFYFFNGAQWVALQQAQVDDADFYEEGTTTAPDDINDDMYTQGNIGIGQVTADYKLDITEDMGLKAVDISVTGDVDGNRIAIENYISGTQNAGIANQIYGLRNTIYSGGGFAVYGIENFLSGNYTSQKSGISNIIFGGSGNHYGVITSLSGSDTSSSLRYGIYNSFNYNNPSNGNEHGVYNLMGGTSTSTKYGVVNFFTNSSDAFNYGVYNVNNSSGNGRHYGNYTTLAGSGTGSKYGTYNFILSTAGGTHYGVYSSALKAGSYAGYFLGDVSIGTTIGNSYIMPDSDGSAGQIMQTDGAGNVDWVDNANPISSIPIYSSNSYSMNHGTGGIDLTSMNSSIEPSIYNPSGMIQVKLVIRYSNALGTNNFQLRAHDGTAESFPITNASGWTFAATQNGGVATSDWVNWNAGVNAHEIHVFGWNASNNPASDSITIDNAYLLVRSQ